MPAQGKGQSLPTHESRLALLLHEEQLPPIGGSGLHPKDHQVAHRQHPQEGREQEVGQGALAGTWGAQAHTARSLNHRAFLRQFPQSSGKEKSFGISASICHADKNPNKQNSAFCVSEAGTSRWKTRGSLVGSSQGKFDPFLIKSSQFYFYSAFYSRNCL